MDLAEALQRLGGRSDLLCDALRAFARDHAADDQALAAALTRGAGAEARRLAHTLKGVAANLAMHRLAASAGEVETAIAQHGAVAPALLVELGNALREAAAAAAAVAEPDHGVAPSEEVPDLAAALHALHRQLECQDFAAESGFRHLRGALTHRIGEDATTALATLIEHYDFAAARVALDDVRRRLGWTGEVRA